MRLLFSILIAISLNASQSLLDLYQQQGSIAIEKVFDAQLSTKEYWEHRLKDMNTSFGYFESINYILACNKNNSHLKLYTKDNNNTFKLSNDFSAFTGKKEGDKQREGDLKTPIGVYKLIKKLDDVDSFYGPLAFVTSYPNTYDKVRGKNGSGIWLHGLPLKQKRDDFTKGCIAINNTHLKNIEMKIKLKESLVYIDTAQYIQVPKSSLVSLLSGLYRWKTAWKENDIETYLGFYHPDFKRQDGLNLKRFKRYKHRVFAKNEYKQIDFSHINIMPYPLAQKDNIYLISFKEVYRSPSYQFTGNKEIYVQLEDNYFSILAEN